MHRDSHSFSEGDINNTSGRAAWMQAHHDQYTTEILERDSRAFLHQALSTPCLDVVTGSCGISMVNMTGRKYMDFHGNNVHQLGYKNEFILDRVKAQMERLVFSPRRFTNLPAIELAERLSRLCDGRLSRALFTPGGTSAVSIALKLARVATGKFKTISMYDAFHGASMDSISVGGEYGFQQELGPLLAGSIHVPPVDNYRGMWYNPDSRPGDMAYADYIEYVIKKEGDIGALIAETVRSTTVHIPSKAYWKKVREICDRHKVLLILDEIPIAMGRTGMMFAFEHYDILPDILVLGKGLGAGIIPMAAVLCKEELNVAGHVSLGHFTHEKNPLGATAALAAFDYMEEYGVLGQVQEMSLYMHELLNNLTERFESVGDVRGMGMLWGIELVTDRETCKEDYVLAEKVLYTCLSRGLVLKVAAGNILCLYPPLVSTKEELERAVQIIEEALIINL